MNKVQGQLKQFVQTEGKLLLTWRNDAANVVVLLRKLMEIEALTESVTQYRNNLFLQQTNSSNSKDGASFAQFFSKYKKTLAMRMENEEEYLRKQIKSFWTNLENVCFGMQQLSQNSMALLANQELDFSNEIFTAEHVLQIQHFETVYAMELNRKMHLVMHVLSGESLTSYFLASKESSTNNITSIDNWSDKGNDSFIPRQSVASFLTVNNIQIQAS